MTVTGFSGCIFLTSFLQVLQEVRPSLKLLDQRHLRLWRNDSEMNRLACVRGVIALRPKLAAMMFTAFVAVIAFVIIIIIVKGVSVFAATTQFVDHCYRFFSSGAYSGVLLAADAAKSAVCSDPGVSDLM